MKKFVVKHWTVSYWVIVSVVLTAITLLLLCGAAQACERSIHPDSTKMSIPQRPKGRKILSQPLYYDTVIVHRRIVSPGDWCVGRVDTVWTSGCYHKDTSRYSRCSHSEIDTTWVLCCDSAARGLKKKRPYYLERRFKDGVEYTFINDSVGWVKVPWPLTEKWWYMGGPNDNAARKTLRQLSDEAARGLKDTIHPTLGSIVRVDTSFVMSMRYRPIGEKDSTQYYTDTTWSHDGWVVNPERWYIESVDTLCSNHPHQYGVTPCGPPCVVSQADTNWAKKIPLAGEYLTPKEWEMLKRLANGWVGQSGVGLIWRPARKDK